MKKTITILGIVTLVLIITAGLTLAADNGPVFRRNVSRTPNTMTGASQMSSMWLYVPAQDPQGNPPTDDDGNPSEIEYLVGDCKLADGSDCAVAYTRSEVKPLFVTYNDGMIEEVLPESMGGGLTGAGFGERDAFAALSLDDGATWKNWNLSDSALNSSFVLKNGHDYPGDVFKIMHAVEGNKIVVAYISRFCESGAPLYSWLDEEKTGLLTAYPELDHPVNVEGGTDPDGFYQLYMDDMFTVGGTQVSVDYTLQGFPEVGEIPYGCVWVARGTLEQDRDDESGELLFNINGDPIYDIVWRASERLTSGRRDPNRIDITSAPGAGFIISWQEDPEGLRPGKGLGPGEGWSGAIANSKTDIWYTYIDLDHFDDVCLDAPADVYCEPGTLAEFVGTDLYGTKPKAAVPFAMPLRLTDNSQCKYPQKNDINGDLLNPYCYADFNENGAADFCATRELWTNPGGTTLEVCVTEDGRHMTGRTASTRVRWAMKPYDSDADGSPDSAWVLLGEEKMKALGTLLDEEGNPEDIGKNMWYHTFEWNNPEIMGQGLMLNAPALSPDTGEILNGGPLVDEWGYELYDTEIARRFNLFVNSPGAAMASTSKTMGFLIYKEGILFQGGPADIFIRRLVLPTDFDPAVDNPFAYENVECVSYDDEGNATSEDLLYADGLNPNYLRGLCPVSGMNVSSTTIQLCDDGSSGEACADQFPFSATYEEWFSDDNQIQIPKVTEWVQGPDNYNDASWENPYDVSKGHRGFIDGDFVMMMYATAPNWKAGTVGNEAYNLYIRRSFDGGQTWTTLPATFAHIDGNIYSGNGTEVCEDWGWGGTVEYENCVYPGPGEFEPARNVSRLTGAKVTVLDPRYSPTGGMLKQDYSQLLCYDETAADGEGDWINCGYAAPDPTNLQPDSAPYPEDLRDASVFFATFETGDNTVVNVETGANPLDMYYSRASNFGDDWDVQDVCNLAEGEEPWYPSSNVTCEEGETDLRWDWLETGDDWATEASVYGNPNGDRFYAVWNQELPLDVENEIFADMDTEYRRIFYNIYLDTIPTASVVYISSTMLDQSADEEVTIQLWAKDFDSKGIGSPIMNYVWFDEQGKIRCVEKLEDNLPVCTDKNRDGICDKCADINHNMICDEDESVYYECTKETVIPARTLNLGWNKIWYRVRDNEGNWFGGEDDYVAIFVAEHVYHMFLPTTSQE